MTTSELAAAGITYARMRALVRRGVLLPAGRGVLARHGPAAALAARPGGERTLLLAAVLATRPGAVGSHHDAALVHGLALLDRPAAEIAVTRRPDAAGSYRAGPGIRLHIAALTADQICVVNWVPVTTAARTVIDLARTMSFQAGVVTADSALHRKLTTRAELEAVVAGCARWPGIERARKVVAFSDARAESPFESIARVAFRDGGLPPPDLQVWVGGEVEVIGRVDFLWRDHHTVAEADGAVKYSDPSQAMRQLRRDAELRAAGYEVVHFTWRELASAPSLVIASIREAFARAAALRGS